MKKALKSTLAVAAAAATLGVAAFPAVVSAWGPSRQTYSLREVNEGALGESVTFNSIVFQDSDYEWFKNTYGEEIKKGNITDERNFVGARENTGKNEGADNVWQGNEIEVEDGKTYLVRLYVHNNSPKNAAKDVKAKFFMPSGYKAKQTIDGQITASNAMYDAYWDYVDFVSKDNIPFKLEYVEGSASLENKHFSSKNGGLKLSDDLVKSEDGILIGYDALNGVIPGCYDYATYLGIEVKAVYQPQFTVEKKVRIVGDSDKTWKKTVNAKVGDKVEFQIEYRNVDTKTQEHITIRDILPNNLSFVEGSAVLYNTTYPKGVKYDGHTLIDNGLRIGSYLGNSNAFMRFTAEVVDKDLACGSNTLVNWGRASVDDVVRQDYARVVLNKVCEDNPEPEPTPTPDEPETPPVLPETGPSLVAGGVAAAGSLTTAAGYYIASRRRMH